VSHTKIPGATARTPIFTALTVLVVPVASMLITTAGTNVARAEAPSVCERANGDAGKLLEQLRDVEKLPEVHRDASYIAFQDKKTWAMWTFTREGLPAHPAVVCRRPVQDGQDITLEMVIGCAGEDKACTQLRQDFGELNARMQLEIENKQKRQ